MKQENKSIKIKRLNNNATIPSYITEGSAGLDLTAVNLTINGNCYEYSTGIAVEIPKGYVGLIFPKSGIYKKDLVLTNCVGVIDSDYRGEIKFKFKKYTDNKFDNVYNVGDKIGQLIIVEYPKIEFVEVDELEESGRGSLGFGEADIKNK